MRILLTGAQGFLGWHTRLRLHALSDHNVVAVGRDGWCNLETLLGDVDAVLHLAGVNRGSDAEVEQGNVTLAEHLADAVKRLGRPVRVVYANSTQDGNGTPYGTGKQRAAGVLRDVAAHSGGRLVDVHLPNIFGEHGRPAYNSFVATFVRATIEGRSPQINDTEVELLHAQDAARVLVEALDTEQEHVDPRGTPVSVRDVWDVLAEFHRSYASGEIPDLGTPFRIDLFNTYRAALFPTHAPIPLTPHTDHRGHFVETVRCRGGQGQTSISTTVPGITRGEHYHLHKVERFAVVQGTATISLRKMFTDEVIDFRVTGDVPTAIDMPTGWVHNITNTGQDMLLTQFWAHELFRPDATDTFFEKVRPEAVA